MSVILSIETATPVCSVALHSQGILLGEYTLLKDKSHSDKLAVLIERLVHDCGYTNSDLTAIGLSLGPGSYTGLRIGASTAKGLCYGLDIPLITVNSLTALATQVQTYADKDAFLIPMFDARRMEVYAQVLNTELKVIKDTTPVIVDDNSFCNFLDKNKVYLFGDGATKCKSVIKHPNAVFLDGINPTAKYIGEIAINKWNKEDFADVAYFEPFYLKEYKAGKPKTLN